MPVFFAFNPNTTHACDLGLPLAANWESKATRRMLPTAGVTSNYVNNTMTTTVRCWLCDKPRSISEHENEPGRRSISRARHGYTRPDIFPSLPNQSTEKAAPGPTSAVTTGKGPSG